MQDAEEAGGNGETERNMSLGAASGEESKVLRLTGFVIQLRHWTSARGHCEALREITRFDVHLRLRTGCRCEEWIG